MSESRHFRKEGREPIALRVRYGRDEPDAALSYEGTTSDVSLGGAFVRGAHRPAVGERLRLELVAPSAWDPLVLAGEVRRVEAGGFGVRFERVTGARATALYDLLSANHYLGADG